MGSRKQSISCSKHSNDQFVDLVLSVAPNTTVVIRMSLLFEAFSWGVELEWPEEVVSFLEVWADSGNLVDKIFNACNSVLLAEGVLNDSIVGKRNSGAVNLAVASLVDKLSNGLLRWVTIGDVWLDSSEHVNSGLVQSNEHTVVQLSQSKELHDLFALRVKLVDTINEGY